ncbi:hypothetical protein LAZ67_4001548 [Cordylochernes scorpioides]|uniref:Uncharacterized protein n=1 Tax=Cordylochernes scorpioides TaxID=51811 RepID=A0ABY6KC22_9ARAC|nr:hypothetical protein LAZ67_4001548 [Cordylochernes scorpioides]
MSSDIANFHDILPVASKSVGDSEAVRISKQRVQNILHEELGIRNLCARWVPHLLNEDPKKICKRHSQKSSEPFKIQPIWCDDLSPWMRHGSTTTRQKPNSSQSSGWKPTHPIFVVNKGIAEGMNGRKSRTNEEGKEFVDNFGRKPFGIVTRLTIERKL